MKTTLLSLLIILGSGFSWSNDTIISFRNSKVALPYGFKELPEDLLNALKAETVKKRILTGYQNLIDNKNQRIMIHFDSIVGTNNIKFNELVKIKREVIQENGIKFYDVKIDAKKHFFYGKATFKGVSSLLGFSYDDYGIMELQYYNLTGMDDSQIPVFEKVLQSIQHKTPYNYVYAESNKVTDSREKMEKNGYYLTVALIVLVISWLIRKFVLKNE